MDKKLCDITNGNFVGHGDCDFTPSPCPVCTAAEFPEENCQAQTAGFIFGMDRVGAGGRAIADDFIAQAAEIGQFCFFRLTSPSEHPYGSEKYGSRYQGQRGPTPSRSFQSFHRTTI